MVRETSHRRVPNLGFFILGAQSMQNRVVDYHRRTAEGARKAAETAERVGGREHPDAVRCRLIAAHHEANATAVARMRTLSIDPPTAAPANDDGYCPMRGALAVMDALPAEHRPLDSTPLRDAMPGAWPTVGDLRSVLRRLEEDRL